MQLARLWYVFLALVISLTGLWWLSLAPGAFTGDFWLTRKTLVMGTGVLAFGLMSVGVTPGGAAGVVRDSLRWARQVLPIAQMARHRRFRLCDGSLGFADGTIVDQLF